MPRGSAPTPTLLDDADVRRWYENLARGSPATADVNLHRLGAVCVALNTTPRAMATLDEKAIHDRLLDFVAVEERRGVAGSYILRTIKAAKSWLLHNGVKVQRPIKVRGASDSPTLREERVPTQEELRAILLAGTPRIRSAVSLVAFAGLRPEVLGNYRGDDGLTIADFPELEVKGSSVEFSATPTLVKVRRGLSKNSNGYFTFLSTEGCEYLKQYLGDRLRSGERLTPETDVIHPDRAGKRFIRTINIGDAIRTAIRGAGFQWRPYVLRHFFDTQLLTAESKGKVAHDFRVFWMGHVGSIDARYTTNKKHLPKEFIEEMRAAYARAEPFLSTVPSRSDSKEDVLRSLLQAVEQANGKKAAGPLTGEDLVRAIKDALSGTAGRDRPADLTPTAEAPRSVRQQRVVPVGDLERLINDGWTYVAGVGADRVVVAAPVGAGQWSRPA